MIDTHTHLFSEEFDEDRKEVINRAVLNGVSKMLLPNIDDSTIVALKDCVALSNGACLPMMGLHPGSVKSGFENTLEIIRGELYSDYPYIGVGEIGIDLYWDKSTFELQKQAFLTQCEWAAELDLPVSIHSREATSEVIECLKSMKKAPVGVFHCFSGTVEEAREISDLGFYLGIGGVLTYKNSTLPEVLKSIDFKTLVLETDAPYLPPHPYRGKRNESAYLIHVISKLSEIYNMDKEELSTVISEQSKLLFKI